MAGLTGRSLGHGSDGHPSIQPPARSAHPRTDRALICARSWALGVSLALVAGWGLLAGASARAEPPAVASGTLKPYTQRLAGSTVEFDMLPIPASADPDAPMPAFWMAKTETTWELFDIFVYGLDGDDPAQTAAVSRPSKPYIPPDRGFGHNGYAVISVSSRSAREFCKWLSLRTGRDYRLATEDQWEYACHAGSDSAYCCTDDPDQLDEHAWYKANAKNTPHAVATRTPNAWGLCDMHGNVAEWVIGRDGTPVTKGGSYLDTPEKLRCDARAKQSWRWNESDPQIPKSQWWLADGPFVGFRIVCIPATKEATP